MKLLIILLLLTSTVYSQSLSIDTIRINGVLFTKLITTPGQATGPGAVYTAPVTDAKISAAISKLEADIKKLQAAVLRLQTDSVTLYIQGYSGAGTKKSPLKPIPAKPPATIK